MPGTVRPFECDLKGYESMASTIYATTRSKVRYQKWAALKDASFDVRFGDITVRPCGPAPQFLENFARTAKYGGLPFVVPGMRVEIPGRGVGNIAGVGGGANFKVIFTEGEYAGSTFYCHPHADGMRYFDKEGKLLYDSAVQAAREVA